MQLAGAVRWLLLLLLLLGVMTTHGQEEGEEGGEEEAAPAEEEAPPPSEDEAAAEGGEDVAAPPAEEGGDAPAAEGGEGVAAADGAGGEEECEVQETEGESTGDDIGDILALGGEDKKCKKKESTAPAADGSGSGDGEPSGADALAAAVGAATCDKEGMDEKVAKCLGGLETKVNELMTAILGPDGGGGSLEDTITLVLVKKGVISCENETQCDDNKQCLAQPDGMSRCQNPCERPEIINCVVPFAECVTEEHKPMCVCKENFHGNGTDVCIPVGFTTEENKRGYRMFDEEYVEWENATTKCQELGARLPVLSDADTVRIVKKYLDTAEFEVFEQWDRSSRRVWLGLQYEPGSGLVWADGQRVMAYPASSRLFVWESRRLLSQEVPFADNTRHYGFYIDGDIAKLPGGGRKGAAVLCELLPDQLAQDPSKKKQEGSPQPLQPFRQQSYPGQQLPPQRGRGGSGQPGRYPQQDSDGGYPNYPAGYGY